MLTSSFLDQADKEFQKTLTHLSSEYLRLNIGRANAALIENLHVEAYGSMQPLKTLGGISVSDARTLAIQPWDKSVLQNIVKAIQTSGLNLNPVDDGHLIRIPIPPLNQERREELVKVVHKLAEDARIAVRHARQHAHTSMKNLEQEKKISENDFFSSDKKLQEKVDMANQRIQEMSKAKEKDIMTV